MQDASKKPESLQKDLAQTLPATGLEALTNLLIAAEEEKIRRDQLAQAKRAQASYKEGMSIQTLMKLLKVLGGLVVGVVALLLVYLMQKYGVVEGGGVNWARVRGELRELSGEEGAVAESIAVQARAVGAKAAVLRGEHCSTHEADTLLPSKKTQVKVFKALAPLEAYAYVDCLMAKEQLKLAAPLLYDGYKQAKAKKLDGAASAYLALAVILDQNAGALTVEAKKVIAQCKATHFASAPCALSALYESLNNDLASPSLLALDAALKKNPAAAVERFKSFAPVIGNLYAFAMFNAVGGGDSRFVPYDAVAREWMLAHTSCPSMGECIPSLVLRSIFLRYAVRMAFAHRSFDDVQKLIAAQKKFDFGRRMQTEFSLFSALSAKAAPRGNIRKIVAEAEKIGLFKDDEELKALIAPTLRPLKVSIGK